MTNPKESSTDELLQTVRRDNHAQPAWQALDARCKAGDLPKEWEAAAIENFTGISIADVEAGEKDVAKGNFVPAEELKEDLKDTLKLTGNENAVNCDRHGEPIAFIPANGKCPACRLEAERERLWGILDRSFGYLPTTPGDALVYVDNNIEPHVVQVADEFAILTAQNKALEARLELCEAVVEKGRKLQSRTCYKCKRSMEAYRAHGQALKSLDNTPTEEVKP